MEGPIQHLNHQQVHDQPSITAAEFETVDSSTDALLTDFIRVYGLNGDVKSTWTQSSREKLLDHLKLQIPQSRVLDFNYNSHISKAGWELVSPLGIWNTAVHLLSAILIYRGGSEESAQRPTIFIAQGFGGIIVKQALWIANHHCIYLPIAARTLGVVFLDTPHGADDRNSWERIVFNMAATFPGNEIKPEIFVSLGRRAHPLDISGWAEVSEKFYSIATKYKIISIIETKKITLLPLREESVEWGNPKDQQQLTQDESYSILRTFESNDHEGLIRLFGELKRLAVAQKDFDSDLLKCRQGLTAVYREPSSSNPSRYPGTLDWIWKNDEYQRWWNNNYEKILHLRGSAGKGKTTLCTLLSSKLRKDQEAVVLSFFCNGSDNHREPAKDILLSMVQQLLYHEPSIYSHIETLYSSLAERSTWAKEDIWGLFRAMLSHPRQKPLVCLIDSLDECQTHSSHDWLFEHLAGLQQETDFPFMLVVSSQRPAGDFENVPVERFIVIDLDNVEETHHDVKKVASGWVSDLVRETPALNGLEEYLLKEMGPLLAQPTTTLLTAKIWLALLAQPHPGWTQSSLSNHMSLWNPSLCHLYKWVLNQVSTEHRFWAKKALSWISHSYRPLKLSEMYIVMSTKDNRSDEWVGPLDIIGDLTCVLGPLVRIERDEIHLVHPSFKEFLLDHKTQSETKWYSSESGITHAEIFDTCLAYLSAKDILKAPGDNKLFERDIKQHILAPFSSRRMGLLLYASQYWPKHYQRSATVLSAPSGYVQVLEFLRKDEARIWYHINRLLEGQSSEKDIFSPLIVAAKLGLPLIVAELQKEANSNNDDRQTALEWAATNGHIEVVIELLTMSKELQLSTALMNASRMGHKQVVKALLLEKGLSDDTQSLEAALSVSAKNGHAEIVQLFLGMDTAVNSIYEKLTPLQHAAQNGREHVIKVLLQCRDIEVSRGTTDGDSSIHLAAQNGYLVIVGLLLDAGSSAAADEGEISPLHLAAHGGHLKVVKRIIDAGPELATRKDYFQMNALHWAAYEGHLAVVEKLIEAKVSVDEKDFGDRLPLHIAAAAGHVGVVDALLKHLTVDIDTVDWNGLNALQHAASQGYTKIVYSLLDKGADPAGDCQLGAPLHLAAKGGHIDVITALVAGGASVDQRSGVGLTPIHVANLQPAAIAQLIELGANVNALSPDKTSPLMLAAEAETDEGVRLLLKAGAIAQSTNENNSTALHRAAERSNWGTVEALLSSNASPFIQEASGDATPIDTAIINGHKDVAREMIDWIIKKNYWRDPFQMAVGAGTEDLIELWLEHRPRDKNVVSTLGTPTLLLFAARGIVKHVDSLLASGVDKNVRDLKGRVALDVALHPEVRRLLDPPEEQKDTEDNAGATENPSKESDVEDSSECTRDNPTEKMCALLTTGTRPKYNNLSSGRDCNICDESIDGFFYHCCECRNDNYDICLACYETGKRCQKPSEHKLKIRFAYDRMTSFEELSPWVRTLQPPIMTEEDNSQSKR